MRGDKEIIEAAERVDADQEPELARPGRCAQAHAGALGLAGARIAGAAKGWGCGAGRPDEQQHERQQQQVGDAAPHEHVSPAVAHQDDGEDGDNHQLARAHAGADDAVGEAGTVGEGAAHHQRDGRDRGDAVADRKHHAVEDEQLPRRRHGAHQAHADGADDEPPGEHGANAEPVGEPSRQEHARRGDDEIDRDGGAEHGAADGKLLGDGLEGEADGKARPAANEQHEEADGHDGGARHGRGRL